MERSRRDLLRVGGALLATGSVGLAGCIEERVTQRETRVTDTNTWTLSPADEDVALDSTGFESYVEEMADRYGDSGVRGLEATHPDSFGIAYSQRYAITRPTPGTPTESEYSLEPETVDPEAPLLIADSCLVRFDLGENRYRYWLWVAADPTDGRLVRDVNLLKLSTGIRLRNGVVTDTAAPVTSDGEASVDLGMPPSGSFPVRGGSLQTTTVRGADGVYLVDWRGDLDAPQSANGVCEVERTGDYDLFWTTSLGYGVEEMV